MDVQPQNLGERAFALLVLTMGLILASWFISSMTASMTQLRNMQSDGVKQFWLLRRYLRQQGVPQELQLRVIKYVEYVVKSQRQLVPRKRVEVLSYLSEQLTAELQCEVDFRPLLRHPLLECAWQTSDVAV